MDKDNLKTLFENMLLPDTEKVNKATNTLIEIAKTNSDSFVYNTILILSDGSINEQIKQCAATTLRKAFGFSLNNQQGIYENLSPETKEFFKKEILISLTKNENQSLINSIANLIGFAAGQIIDGSNGTEWPNLIEHIHELFKLENKKIIIAVFKILEGIVTVTPNFIINHKTSIFPMFEFGFDSSDSKIMKESLSTATSLIEVARPKDIKELKNINIKYLQALARMYEMKEYDDLENCVGYLYDICEMEPSFFKQRFEDIVELVSTVRSVFADNVNNNFKDQTVECLLMLIERYPEIIKIKKNIEKNENPLDFIHKEKLDKVVELIFMNMVEVEDEIDEEWACPPEGFNDDLMENDDQKNIKNGMNFIDRLIQIFGKNMMLTYLSGFIEKMMGVNNWKYKLAGLMALSQVGEYMSEKVEEIKAILQLVHSFIDHENPRLRYACCHILGQFADDLAPSFQESYHNEFLQMMVPRLDDNVPRVRAHSLAAFTNFLESCNSEHVQNCFDLLFSKFTNILLSGISYEKENALSALASLSESCPDNFEKFYDETMKILLQILGSSNKKEFRQLRGQSIETITIISEQMPLEKFGVYVKDLIQLMVNIQNNDITYSETDPQKSYLLAGYQRLCKILGNQMGQFLPQIIPGLIKMASTPCLTEEVKSLGIKSYDKEESELAIQMLEVFIENLDTLLIPYLNEIYGLIVELMENSLDEETKLLAADCLPTIVKIAKKSGQIDYKVFAKEICKKLWMSMDTEHAAEILEEQGRSLQKVIEEAGEIYNETELNDLYELCINHLKRSESRKIQSSDIYDYEEEDEKEIEILVKQDKELEEQFSCQIAEIFGAIFKTHKKKALSIAYSLYENYISNAVKDNMPFKIIKFGIFLIDDTIDHLGEYVDAMLLEKFYETLIKFCLCEDLEVRHAAIYGVGALALCIKNNFIKFYDQSIKVLTTAHEIECNNPVEEFRFDITKDNVVSAIGKILRSCFDQLDPKRRYDIMTYWLNHLPLLNDKIEGNTQHKFLIEFIMNQSAIVIGNNYENIPNIIRIFERLCNYKGGVVDEELRNQMSIIIKEFLQNESIKQFILNLQLSEDEKLVIETLNNLQTNN